MADKPGTSFVVVAGGGIGGSITGKEAVFGASVSIEILNRDNPSPMPAMPNRNTKTKRE